MACGLPVVATAVGGIPEQVDDGITGLLVAPEDSSAMASGIERILKSPELSAQMSQAAASKAKTHYSIELQTERYLRWFEDILQAQSR
jgi:glycosyltransferase involved in cell wall biosynthesis